MFASSMRSFAREIMLIKSVFIGLFVILSYAVLLAVPIERLTAVKPQMQRQRANAGHLFVFLRPPEIVIYSGLHRFCIIFVGSSCSLP